MKEEETDNQYHFRKPILRASILLILTFTLFLCQTQTPSPQPSIRILEQHQDEERPSSKQEFPVLNLSGNTFLLAVVIGSIVFVLVALICCIVCIIRYIFRIERLRGANGKVINARTKYGAMCPAIQYELFVTFVGRPFQQNCVICLEQFDCKSSIRQSQDPSFTFQNLPEEIVYPASDEIKIQMPKEGQKKDQIKELKPTQYVEEGEKQVNLVKLTVCGHLLHANCPDSWLEKEENCPLCRQAFTLQNLQAWQMKLGINLLKQNFQTQSINNSNTKVQHFQETLNSINKSNEQNTIQLQNEMEYNKKIKELRHMYKEVLLTCAKIMAYHKKEQFDLTKIQRIGSCIQFQDQNSTKEKRELHFEENEQQVQPNAENDGVQAKIESVKENRRKRLNKFRAKKQRERPNPFQQQQQ